MGPIYCYGRPHFATCLEITCREKDCVEYAKPLSHAGADPNLFNPKTKQTALQVAVEMRNIQVLIVLLKDRPLNINAVHDELTKVIAELEQQTRNDKTKQDDEESKYCKEEIQELKSILSTRTSENLGKSLTYLNKYRSDLEQTLF